MWFIYGRKQRTQATLTPPPPHISYAGSPFSWNEGVDLVPISPTNTGGTEDVVYSIFAGSLPTGVNLDADTGVIDGNPSISVVSGTTCTIRATGPAGHSDYTITYGVTGAISGTDINDLIISSSVDGRAVLQFTAPDCGGGSRADTYDLIRQIKHISPETVGSLTVTSNHSSNADPGQPQTITIDGLEEGQTLQFVVRAVKGALNGSWSMAGYGAACLIQGDGLPTPSGTIVHLSAPQDLLDTPDIYYILDNDINATGTAFPNLGPGCTFDLNGHTITYGLSGADSCHGIDQYYDHTTRTRVVNGSLISGGGGASCHAIYQQASGPFECRNLDISIDGADTKAIYLVTSGYNDAVYGLRVTHCTTHDIGLTVTNRHAIHAIIDISEHQGRMEVDHNTINGAPQCGIIIRQDYAAGEDISGFFTALHHNRVVNTRILVTNGYMLSCHCNYLDVFDNYCNGQSRGIHLNRGAYGETSYNHIAESMDFPNPEYPGHFFGHVMKLEGPTRMPIHHNSMTGHTTQAGNGADIHALNYGLGRPGVGQIAIDPDFATDDVITHNLFRALQVAGDDDPATPNEGYALKQVEGGDGSDSIVNRLNVYVTSGKVYGLSWDRRLCYLLEKNIIIRDGTYTNSRWSNFFGQDGQNESGQRFVNTFMGVGALAAPDPTQNQVDYTITDYSTNHKWPLKLVVKNGGGTPIAGATVTIRDSSSVAGIHQVQRAHIYPGNSVPLRSDVTAGNLLVLKVSWTGDTSTIGTPSLKAGSNATVGTITEIGTHLGSIGNHTHISMWYCVVSGSGSCEIEWGVAGDNGGTLTEYSGINAADPFRTFTTSTSETSTTTPTTQSFTAVAGDLLVLGYANEVESRVVTAAGTFTRYQFDETHYDADFEDRDATAGAQTASVNLDTAGADWVLMVAVFKPDPSPPTPPPTFSGVTDADGICTVNLTQLDFAFPTTVTDHNPMQIDIDDGAGHTYSGSLSLAQHSEVLNVNLTAGTAAVDRTVPSNPSSLKAFGISSHVILLQWGAVSGASAYVVKNGAEVVFITEDTVAAIVGLDPSTTYSTMTVAAVDEAGNYSDFVTMPSATTRPEDRGV